MERLLFFWSGLSRLQGSWQEAIFDGPTAARQAALDWIGFAALPSLESGFRIECQAVSASDKVSLPSLALIILEAELCVCCGP